jgi:hypothetical protein
MSGKGLLKDLEELFQNSEQRVLAAFVVSGGGGGSDGGDPGLQ